MIGRLNHVAIAVRDIAAASALYRDTLGAKVSAPMALPEHGVSVVFVELPNTKIELIEPLGPRSPIAKFLDKHPGGAIHHLCFEVADIRGTIHQLFRARATATDRHPRPWRWKPKNRGAWQTSPFPESRGLFRNPDRTRTGMNGPGLLPMSWIARVFGQAEPPCF